MDTVDFYQYRFQITDVGGGNVGALRFSDPQLDSEGSDANYLFGADSVGLTTFAETAPRLTKSVEPT